MCRVPPPPKEGLPFSLPRPPRIKARDFPREAADCRRGRGRKAFQSGRQCCGLAWGWVSDWAGYCRPRVTVGRRRLSLPPHRSACNCRPHPGAKAAASARLQGALGVGVPVLVSQAAAAAVQRQDVLQVHLYPAARRGGGKDAGGFSHDSPGIPRGLVQGWGGWETKGP